MVTIDDVAERAGVSKTTVSHVLSGKRPVAPGTRDRILQVIAELGFRPSALARSLRIQRTHMVALIMPDITNPYYPVLSRGLQDVLVEHGYHTFLCNTDGRQDQEVSFIADAVQRRVDGIVLSSLSLFPYDVHSYMASGTCFVSIGPAITHPAVDKVSTDDEKGAQSAVCHLIERGHRRIGMIGGPAGLIPSTLRLEGYRSALQEAGIPFDTSLIAEGDFKRPSGTKAMYALMSLSPRPTAIFCANDVMAIGAMDAARASGIAIPGDVALVGYDDIEAASLVTPALTTVINPAYDMGKTAGQFLLERLDETYKGAKRDVIIPHQLIVREST